MGLDIYFHKVKNVRNSKEEKLQTIKDYAKINDERAAERFKEFANNMLKRLKNLEGKAYHDAYMEIFPTGISQFTKFTFTYEKMLEGGIKPYNDVKRFFEGFSKRIYAEYDAYFRKANFVYRYFADKLEHEACFVTMDDLNDLISRCEEVMQDSAKAPELLPTQEGFFFGSTSYDKLYFEDVESCKNQMERLREDFDEGKDIIYVVMSW